MGIVETLRFRVQASWVAGRLLRLRVRRKPALAVAIPPELGEGIAGIWRPEELLVGSLAASYELTLVSIAERRGLPLHALEIAATGHVERAAAGGYGFTALRLDVELETDAGREFDAEEAALLSKEHCIVVRALDVPVHLRLEMRVLSPAVAGAAS